VRPGTLTGYPCAQFHKPTTRAPQDVRTRTSEHLQEDDVVAFFVSLVVTGIMCAITLYVAWRRPVDAPLTWGEAMVGASWFFMLMIMFFGIVPDQWIDWADNELGWKPNEFFYDPATHDFLSQFIPFKISMQAMRDIIVVVIHIVFLALIPPAVIFWQKRGPARSLGEPSTEEPVSAYGRPLVRES
jgi:hypothetical protein